MQRGPETNSTPPASAEVASLETVPLASSGAKTAPTANASNSILALSNETPQNEAAVAVNMPQPMTPVVAALIPATQPAAEQRPQTPAGSPPATAAVVEAKGTESRPPAKRWFEKYSLRGYAQFRYNRAARNKPTPGL
jgi:hypothetical protein